jgi:2'-5' RNA ligase
VPGLLWRLFFAVELSREIQAGVRTVQQVFKERAPGVRWLRPEGIHLTLRFLGDVELERVEDIWGRAAREMKPIDPFPIVVRGCGGFPTARRPRVIWIGIEDPSGSLRAMQARVEKGMRELGFPHEERGYNPHLTLGRLHPGKGQEMAAQAIETNKTADLGQMEVQEVCLFRSQLKPTGAEYTKLKVMSLGTVSQKNYANTEDIHGCG